MANLKMARAKKNIRKVKKSALTLKLERNGMI